MTPKTLPMNSLAYLFVILLISLISKVGVFNQVYSLSPAAVIQSDTNRYEDPAIQLLNHGTLAINPSYEHTTTLSTTPVYSLIIAGTYKVFGEKNHFALIILQILINTLTIFIIYLIALKLWSKKVALIAAFVTAIEPLQTLYTQTILSETLFTFFLTASLLAFVYLVLSSNNKLKLSLGLGILFTLTTMTRPISYYLVLCVIFGLLLFKSRVSKSWSQLLIMCLLILLPFLFTTTLWKVRNNNLTGVYALNDAMSETLLYYKAKGVLMLANSHTEEEAHSEILKRLPPNFKTPKERANAESKLAKEIILGDVVNYFKLSLNGLKAIVLGPGLKSQAMFYDNKSYGKNSEGDYKPWNIALIAYGIVFLLITYSLSTYGFFSAFKNTTPQNTVIHFLMLGTIFYFILISTGHIATDSRMRVPIIPIILLYASHGAYQLFEVFKSRKIRKTKHSII